MTPKKAEYPNVDGIWRCLSPDRAQHWQQFLDEYTAIRMAEGRACDNSDYYRRLPEPTPGGPIEWQWNIRRNTWRTVRTSIIPANDTTLTIIDVGAGNCWLSNRLSKLGHHCHAVDLTIDQYDGLGAAHHYTTTFDRYQAEMDNLPFADGVADIVIYNASLHYSTDYHNTLEEALRVLRQDGRIIILETPLYKTKAAGDAMVAERHARFATQYGTRSDTIPSIEYITNDMLAELGNTLNLRWRRHHTWYGLQWALRPIKARLQKKRPPSRFIVLEATRNA